MPQLVKNRTERGEASASESYGRPFIKVFKEANYDFYRIDPDLFAPAILGVNNARTGRTSRSGKISLEIFKRAISWCMLFKEQFD